MKFLRRLVRSRGAELSNECLMLGVKQTSKIKAITSACDPERTSIPIWVTSARIRPNLILSQTQLKRLMFRMGASKNWMQLNFEMSQRNVFTCNPK